MRLHELVDQFDVPPTRVAEDAWEQASRRLRRRRFVVVAAAAVAVVAALAATLTISGRDGASPPANPPTPTTSSPAGPDTVTPDMATSRAYAPNTFERLLQTPISPPDDSPPLSQSPVAYAKLVMTPTVGSTEVYLLGPDDSWRRLDVPLEQVQDGSGYRASPFRSTSLSPDATMLALPQPSELVVVDLTDGSHRRYPVPSQYLTYANWLGDSRVVVATEMSSRGWEIDLGDGTVQRSNFGPSTGRSPEGQLVTWGLSDDGFATRMRWDNGTEVFTGYNNDAGPHPFPPLVDEDVVVGHSSGGPGLPLWDNAMLVVDRHTGGPLAYLPTQKGNGDLTTLLGWDDDRVVVALYGGDVSDARFDVVLVAWDWREKTLEPLVTVSGSEVAWGRGW